MRKLLILTVLLMISVLPAWAQKATAQVVIMAIGTVTPTVCNPGDIFFNTASVAGSNLFLCGALNTYTQIGGGPTSVNSVQTLTGNVTLFNVNAQTSTYQTLAADFTHCKVISVASGTFNVTMVASGSQPPDGQCVDILNYGTGVVTIVRSGQNINGATTSLVIPAAVSAQAPNAGHVWSNGTNYFAWLTFGAVPPQFAIKSCVVITGDPGAASPVLADDNDTPVGCDNDTGVDWTITAVACWADASSAGQPTMNPILTGGSSTSILSSAVPCGNASWAAGTVNGSPVVHTFANGNTCASTPCSIDSNIATAGGTAKYIVMKITGTIPRVN